MRYCSLTQKNREDMLQKIGCETVQDLYRGIPFSAFGDGGFSLPDHTGEIAVERMFYSWAQQNRTASQGPFFLGAGCYRHHVPASVDTIIQRSEFLTAYTPYQPELAQGTLQALFEYQSMICLLTGQDIANASLYDGATAMAEAALLCMRQTKRKQIILATPVHPHYTEVLASYTHAVCGEIVSCFDPDAVSDYTEAACLIVQSPDFLGMPHAYDQWREVCDKNGAMLIVVITEFLSLGLLPPPSCADIVCGEAQSIGNPMSFGGPHLGFFACNKKFLRQMPGRLCGESLDADGQRAFVLTLSTREQHIRREKATSNICTNQGLCALAFTAHMALLGEDGFKKLARLNHEKACLFADTLTDFSGIRIETPFFFNEFCIRLLRCTSNHFLSSLLQKGILAGYPVDEHRVLLAATEMTTSSDIVSLSDAIKEGDLA